MSPSSASAAHHERMLAEQRAHEPSMEEILASIRRIIADDRALPLTPRPVAEPQPAAVLPEPAANEAGEPNLEPRAVWTAPHVFEREQVVEQEPVAAALAASVAPAAYAPTEPAVDEAEPTVALRDIPAEEPLVAAAPETAAFFERAPESAMPEPAQHEPAQHEPSYFEPVRPDMPSLTSPVAPESEAAPLLSEQVGKTVVAAFDQLAETVAQSHARLAEEAVRDMLRPMLKTWLDDNLPVIVERLVRTEIERVARGGR